MLEEVIQGDGEVTQGTKRMKRIKLNSIQQWNNAVVRCERGISIRKMRRRSSV